MTLQYIIVTIVIALAAGYALRKSYHSIKQYIKCHDAGCAGCAFYEKCKKTTKKSDKNLEI